MNFAGKWSPYIAGPLLAIVFLLGYYLLDAPVGSDEGYRILSDYCKQRIETGRIVDINEYPPLVSQTAFLGGILIGGFLAALIGKNFKLGIFPEDASTMGLIGTTWKTPVQGLLGGFLVMTGLQLAGASFIGLWSGAILLSTGAWIFIFAIIVWGVIFRGIISMKSSPSSSGKAPKENAKGQK